MLQVARPPIWPLILLIVPLPPRIRLLTRVNKTKTYSMVTNKYTLGLQWAIKVTKIGENVHKLYCFVPAQLLKRLRIGYIGTKATWKRLEIRFTCILLILVNFLPPGSGSAFRKYGSGFRRAKSYLNLLYASLKRVYLVSTYSILKLRILGPV
jgi:hypothetical protein